MNGNGKNGNNGKPMGFQCSACQGGMNGCGGPCGWRGHGFVFIIVKIIVGLIVLGIVFSFGVLVGELKATLGGGFGGRSMMRSYYGSPVGAYPMMGGQGYAIPGSTSTTQ